MGDRPKEINLIYSVCYYYGKNKLSNLSEHLNVFDKIDLKDKLFSVQVMVNNEKNIFSSKKEVSDFLSRKGCIFFDVITSFNWGGTVLGLWLAYRKYSLIYDVCYVAHFEEDFRATNKDWFEDSVKKLSNNNYFIGESSSGKIKTGDDDGRIKGKLYQNIVRLGSPEVWTDGGYYFSSIEKLRKIHDLVGIFHKGNPKTRYEKYLDGISIGEVGFPTLVHHSQLKFDFLNRKDYFNHYG